MAFETANLVNVYSGPNGFGLYIYKSDTDARAVVAAAGYFNNSDDDQVLTVDDRIIVTGDEGGYELAVVSLSSGAVTTGEASIGSVPVPAGGTLTLTRADHNGKTIVFDTAAGSVITLPAATGTGMKFRCVVSVLATSNSHVLKCVGTDMMQGACGIIDTDTSDATIQFAALVGDTFDTITMNRTTTGLAAPGDYVEVEDIIAGVWAVRGLIRADGSVATPFSSAV
ncbi:hypothetical protein KAR91_44790 [Candidatus Pacearchaeota archaeon]|nr:hypothetical protein [Candidatus Pacearchaeota archaeon]